MLSRQLLSGKPAGASARRVPSSLAFAAMGFAASVLLAGCGNTYRPVVSTINPVGPAGQPTKYAYAVSSPSATSPALLTAVDVAGDTVLSTPQILVNPSYFNISQNGVYGFVVNPAGSFNDFGLSNPTGLITSDVVQTTLPANSTPVSITAINVGGSSSTVFVPQTGNPTANPVVPPTIAALSVVGPSLEQQISVGANPVYVFGVDGADRVYAISQGTNTNSSGNPNCPTSGQVASLEAGTLSVSNTICVGTTPVYGVMSADGRRAYVLNKGSNSVSVINVITNAPDTTTATIPVGTNPIWADLTPITNEMVVLNAGDGTHAGSLSIISIPLCTNSTTTGNPNCNTANPTDAVGFGAVVGTVAVGVNPTMVALLHDGTQAFVVNQKDSTGLCNAGEGSVTIVNVLTTQVQATLCGISTATGIASVNASPNLIYGHPTTVAVTTGSPTGKVYVTSPDAQFMTVIYTDTDSVVTHIPLQGYGFRVLVTSP